MNKQIILNGEFHSASSNYLNTNRAFRYGDGLFESIKIINGNPISLEYHFQRITAGLEALMIKQDQTFNLKKINYLGSVNFDSKIYNFDTNHVSDDIIAISEKITSNLKKI